MFTMSTTSYFWLNRYPLSVDILCEHSVFLKFTMFTAPASPSLIVIEFVHTSYVDDI